MSPMVKLPLSMEYALLGFLREGPSYAYQVHQRLEQTAMLHMVWRLKQRQTYALLERLEAERLLSGRVAEQGRRPARRMLQLTPEGAATFARWVVLPVEHGREFRQEFMAKLYFAQRESPQAVATLIGHQQGRCHSWLAEFRQQLGESSAAAALDRLVILFRVGQVEATLAWLEECRAELVR